MKDTVFSASDCNFLSMFQWERERELSKRKKSLNKCLKYGQGRSEEASDERQLIQLEKWSGVRLVLRFYDFTRL